MEAQSDLPAWTRAGSEQDRFDELKRLLTCPTPELETILGFLARTDTSARIRYAARKALDLWTRREQEAGRRPPPAAPSGTDSELNAMLGSDQPAVRVRAAEAIAASARPGLLELVRPRLAMETDPEVKARLLSAFERGATPGDLPVLLPMLADPDHRVRASAVLACGKADLPSCIPQLLALLQDPDHRVRANCTLALGPLHANELLTCLERMLADPQLPMRDAAAYALSKLVEPSTLPLIRKALADPSPVVREKAEKALARLERAGVDEAGRVLRALRHPEELPKTPEEVPAALEPPPPAEDSLDHSNPKVRIRHVTELILNGRRDAVPRLIERLGIEANAFVVSKLLVALGELGDATCAGEVCSYLRHPDPRVVSSAIEALTRLKLHDRLALVRPLLSAPVGRVRAAALLHFHVAEPGFDVRAGLREMLEAREFQLRLAATYVLRVLDEPRDTPLVEPLLSDLSQEVRQAALGLVRGRAVRNDPLARDLLAMYEQGFIERKRRSLDLVPAGRNKRLLAFAIDVVGFALIAAALSAAGALALGVRETPELWTPAVAFGVLVASGWFLARDGARDGCGPGKVAMGLRVVELAGNRGCSRAKSLIRAAFLGVPVLNVSEAALALARSDGRRLADWLLDTQVIDEQGGELKPWHRLALALVYLVGASSVAGLLYQQSGGLEARRLAAVREATGLDLAGTSWQLRAFEPTGELVLERRSLWKGSEAVASLTWAHGGEAPLTDADWESVEQVNARLLADVLGREKLQAVRRESSVATFAGRKAILSTAEFEVRGETGKLAAASFQKGRWILHAVWSTRDAAAMEGLTDSLSDLSARFEAP